MVEKENDLLLQVPKKTDDTIKLYVDGVFIDSLDVNQVCQYRYNILKYIYETEDSSVLDRFYFIGIQTINLVKKLRYKWIYMVISLLLLMN